MGNQNMGGNGFVSLKGYAQILAVMSNHGMCEGVQMFIRIYGALQQKLEALHRISIV